MTKFKKGDIVKVTDANGSQQLQEGETFEVLGTSSDGGRLMVDTGAHRVGMGWYASSRFDPTADRVGMFTVARKGKVDAYLGEFPTATAAVEAAAAAYGVGKEFEVMGTVRVVVSKHRIKKIVETIQE